MPRSFHSRVWLRFCVPTVLIIRGTGISTCCPSTTSFDLALGPDLPRADQLYPGNLRYSAGRIPTFLSLLIPAFSLLNRPRLLPVPLRPVNNAPLPMYSDQCRPTQSVSFLRDLLDESKKLPYSAGHRQLFHFYGIFLTSSRSSPIIIDLY